MKGVDIRYMKGSAIDFRLLRLEESEKSCVRLQSDPTKRRSKNPKLIAPTELQERTNEELFVPDSKTCSVLMLDNSTKLFGWTGLKSRSLNSCVMFLFD